MMFCTFVMLCFYIQLFKIYTLHLKTINSSHYNHIVQTYIRALMFINTDFVTAIVRKDSLFNNYTFSACMFLKSCT